MNNEETLEEVAERIAHNFEEPSFKAGVVYGIIEGAKWQQEQDKNKFSEEEVMDMFHNLSMHLPLHYEFLVKEQFKKK